MITETELDALTTIVELETTRPAGIRGEELAGKLKEWIKQRRAELRARLLKGEKTKIKIVDGDEVIETDAVKVTEHFAVNLSDGTRKYSVTHIPSGLAAAKFLPTLKLAKYLAAEFENITDEWSKDDPMQAMSVEQSHVCRRLLEVVKNGEYITAADVLKQIRAEGETDDESE